jgi:hypothetical protein
VAASPVEHLGSEHVMEDLVPPQLVASKDPVLHEEVEHGGQCRDRDGCVLREIGRRVRDLRPGRGHEMSERRRGQVPLGGCETGHRSLEMIGDDSPGTAEPLERVKPQRCGTTCALRLPHALHDDLEVRSLDAAAIALPVRRAVAANAGADCTGAHLADHRAHERLLDRQVFTGQLGEAPDGPNDRCARTRVVEPFEPEDVSVQRGHPAEEPVEAGKRVFADRQNRVDAER